MASTNSLVRFLELLRLSSVLPDPILVPVPVPFLVPIPISTITLVSVPASVPIPILCSSTGLHPVLVPVPAPSTLPSPFPSCVRLRVSTPVPVPVPILRSFVRLYPRSRSRSVPDSGPAPDPVRSFPHLEPGYLSWYDARVQTPCLANGAVGCSQAPPPVCRDGNACGMKVPTVKQKRIAAEDVLLPFLSPDVGTRWSVSPTCALSVC